MDMSVKLNQPYPSVRAAEPVVEKPLARSKEPQAQQLPDGDSGYAHALSDAESVKSAVSQIEMFLNATRRNLEFSTDEESGKVVVKVIASDTGELIRQIPSEEALRIANSLNDVNSILFDAKA